MMFFEENGCKVIKGKCEIEMKEFEESSVDLVLTDPPFGLKFMGSNWDKAVPKVEVWKECLRVLKPGAFCLVMSAPRQDVLSRMIVNLGDAGFETGFTSIYHTFASGFPKAASISKLVDKRNGAEREIVGEKGLHRYKTKRGQWDIKSGEALRQDFDKANQLTIPASKQAKALDGSYAGFQPKPAVEVVIVCMKPLECKSYVDQAMKNGKGVSWFDDCRIPIIGKSLPSRFGTGFNSGKFCGNNGNGEPTMTEKLWEGEESGRFPANLLCGSRIDVDVDSLIEAKNKL